MSTNAPSPPKRSTADTVATVLLGVVLAGVGGLGTLGTLFGVMATDACSLGADSRCSGVLIGAAYVIGWGGLILAAAVTLVGIIRAAKNGTRMYIWPLIGLGLAGVALAGWLALLTGGTGTGP